VPTASQLVLARRRKDVDFALQIGRNGVERACGSEPPVPSTRRNWSCAVVLMMSLTRAGSPTPGADDDAVNPLSGAM